MFAPIVLFVYNRPEHTKATVEALAQNTLAKESELYIFADGPKNQMMEPDILETRNYIEDLKEKHWFRSVNISEEIQNKGLADSVIGGVSKIIAEFQRVIVLEDDIVTSPFFLEYMNDALSYYRSNKKIWSISGYTVDMNSLKKYTKSVYFGYRASSWGWGTWLDRWERVDWQVEDFDEFILNEEKRNRFNRGGKDMCDMLERQMRGSIDSWAIRWCYQQSKEDMLTVFPKLSYVRNIGCDGSGTHSGISNQFDIELKAKKINKQYDFIEPYLDKQVTKEFYDIFSGALRIRVRNKMKNILNRIR